MEWGQDAWLVVLGGAIALSGSLGVSILQKSWEKSVFSERQSERDSATALELMIKIVEIHRWFRTLSSAIDDCFKDAGDIHMDPGVKVLPLIGADAVPDQFSPSELSLVLQSGDSGLLERLLVLQTNFGTSVALKDEFNSERRAYSQFTSENAIAHEIQDGPEVKLGLPPEKAPRNDAFLSVLNPMVDELMRSSQEGREESRALVLRLQTAFESLGKFKTYKVKFLEDEA